MELAAFLIKDITNQPTFWPDKILIQSVHFLLHSATLKFTHSFEHKPKAWLSPNISPLNVPTMNVISTIKHSLTDVLLRDSDIVTFTICKPLLSLPSPKPLSIKARPVMEHNLRSRRLHEQTRWILATNYQVDGNAFNNWYQIHCLGNLLQENEMS